MMGGTIRQQLKAIAEQTLEIIEAGAYRTTTGGSVDIRQALANSRAGTELIRPGDWPRVREQALQAPQHRRAATVEVTGETTLAACRRLTADPDRRVLALNFASAKNAGGGFLGGSQAQEESLARASGLYGCLRSQPGYYSVNRTCGSLLYTDHAIHSPGVPIFRDDGDTLLSEAYRVGFLTMPAPNLGAMRPDSAERPKVTETFRRRCDMVWALAVARDYSHVVVGAWGCGVFRNKPAVVADMFTTTLDAWRDRLSGVTFAILDRHGTIRGPFEQRLAGDH